MQRLVAVCSVAMAVVMAAPAVAGDRSRCPASTQDCLNSMVKSLRHRGWVGIEMEDRGGIDKMVVTRVIEDSPAARSGFKVGDGLVAVNGVAYSEENQQQLQDMRYAMKPGAEFTYTVSRRGSRVDLEVELGEIPESVMALWIGKHMMEHAEIQMASKE